METDYYAGSMYEQCDLFLKGFIKGALNSEEKKKHDELFWDGDPGAAKYFYVQAFLMNEKYIDNLHDVNGKVGLTPHGEGFIKNGGYRSKILRDNRTDSVAQSVIKTNNQTIWILVATVFISLVSCFISWLNYTKVENMVIQSPIELKLLKSQETKRGSCCCGNPKHVQSIHDTFSK